MLGLLKKEQVVAPTPSASFSEDDRKVLLDMQNHEKVLSNSVFILRSQFSTLSKGLSDCLAKQSWEPLKDM